MMSAEKTPVHREYALLLASSIASLIDYNSVRLIMGPNVFSWNIGNSGMILSRIIGDSILLFGPHELGKPNRSTLPRLTAS
jgi:hypothetical protein